MSPISGVESTMLDFDWHINEVIIIIIFKPDEFENTGNSFWCGWKKISNGAFRHDSHQFPDPDLLDHKSKMIGDCWVVWTENISCIFHRARLPFSNTSGLVCPNIVKHFKDKL